MIRVNKEDVDLDRFEKVKMSNLTDSQLKNPNNLPTHFILEKIHQGKYQGFDQVTYLRKKDK